MNEISISTSRRTEFIEVTARVQDAVTELGRRSGVVTIYCPHTTAALTINERADPDVMADVGRAMATLVPRDAGYAHAEGNSDAHIKASLFGNSVQVPVVDGRLRLGTWQGIFFCEFDGPRSREFWVC